MGEIIVNSQSKAYVINGKAIMINSSEIWPPAGYTKLAALKRIHSDAFFNTGVVADSSTGCDIYFSNDSIHDTNNKAVFGIRRLSGNSDSKKYCLYTKAAAYWAAHAVVFGTVDTSNITGSGNAAKFGGNLMKISVRNGKWYEWDRLIYDGSAQTFSNTDNTPIFLGALAKNSTTIYYQSDLFIRFHEAVFYNSQGEITHRFLPYLNNNNQKGFWDTISGQFTAVNNQNQWSSVENYTLRSLRSSARFQAFGGTGNYQSCVAKKGYKLAIINTQQYFYLTNDTYEIHSGSSFSQSGRILTCSEYNSDWHGNAAWWSDTYADQDDFFPLLYVSTDKANHLLTVYRLAGSDPTTCTISLVQKIYTPEGDSSYGNTLYFHNYYGKGGCNTFVQTAYTKNSYSSNTGDYSGNVVMYRVFSIPALSAGSEVTLLETDALAKGDLGFTSTTSNGGWNGKYLYITFLKELKFWEIDSNGATLDKTIDFYTYTGADFITITETEGFSWYEAGGYFVSLWEPENGNVLDSYADDLKSYAIGTYNFVEPVFYDRLIFDGQAWVDTDIVLPEDSSITVNLGGETSKTAQRPFAATGGGGTIALAYGNGTNSSNRQMVAYYASSSYLTYYNLAWSYTSYGFYITPKKYGWGNAEHSYTKGNSHPTGTLRLGNWSDNDPAYTGYMKEIKIYGSDAQNCSSYSAFESYTPNITLRPCTYNGEAGLWNVEQEKFYGNTAGVGQLTVANDT